MKEEKKSDITLRCDLSAPYRPNVGTICVSNFIKWMGNVESLRATP